MVAQAVAAMSQLACLPARTVAELMAHVKANPGTTAFASGGKGASNHLAGELLRVITGVPLLHVPYNGNAPAMNDVIAGNAHLYFTSPASAMPFMPSGRLRMVAVASLKRSALLPEVPTLAESGVEGINEAAAHMIMAPAATPKDILARLNREMVTALQTPAVKSRLANEGAEAVGNAPEAAVAMVRADLDKWIDVVRRTNIKLE